ncbi:50S ribosomal protein L2 [Candidatus Nomurabacteria bacterium RIFCSPLOWO2_01_FULL_42_20]|uniref:Large ribosomal subunit protein uL2 n=2 Tax=Parcubacteria group TaxID=1794811 RepID=A0A0H4T0L8_9BACT|nr:50S ribosomal protein L2 [uncultured Parcubacteria bacterium Rifle_16ft_4_minimus_13933]OGI70611.1 MAG: 50S ribosomal protein L2 [Candidatus Nomurabacteria bacterium RIFCSPHIGHO2_01_FULL_42_16]OGI91289.1 MAG: 50S ribosomal protein L2 [Candidatus Nomurabacteria bacterium RIFCSPLOWO2_01_FULL_42_20]
MKSYKPTSPSRRNMATVTYRGLLTRSEPEKSLTRGFKRGVGRNNQGRITVRHKGGGVHRLYREIDFKYNKKDIRAMIKTIEYDPNRSGLIALVQYADGEKRYILVSSRALVGDTFIVSEKAPVTAGNRLPLKNIPVGTFVHSIELKPGGGVKIARSAGNFAQVVANYEGYTHLKMPSTEVRKIPEKSFATIGVVSNEDYHLVNSGKAGRSRWRGIRPSVRGSAMNPVDHPHGGGEGRQPIGMPGPKTPWGKPARGVKTRKPKKYSNQLIISRRKTGKK